MLDRLHEFIGLLRKNRVRVSTAEVLGALAAALQVGLQDPLALAAALEVCLIKRPEDNEVFRELFDLFFFRPGSFTGANRDRDEAPLVTALRGKGLSEEELEHLLAILASEAARLDPTARMALGLRSGHAEALIRLGGLQVDWGRLTNPLQVGFFTQQVLERLQFRQAEGSLREVGQRLERAFGSERAAEVLEILMQNLGRLRTAVRTFVNDEFQRRNVQFIEQFRAEMLAHKPFGQMTEDELRRLRAEVERLARKLKAMARLRPRKRRRGRLDVRRTLRLAMPTGGVPFALRFRNRRVEKPRLVVLCDISDSVRNVSRFMLQFAYTLQELFSKVRSFVFVSDLGETTDLFKEHDLHKAVDLAYAGAVINVHANSNFGRAFRLFAEEHLDAITTRTTVIIIGDGRNNYHPPEAWALARVRARARHVLWLNPEPPAAWSFGDSAMRDYEPHVSRVEVVNNLASLSKVIDGLVL
jgi:hypothetical protein